MQLSNYVTGRSKEQGQACADVRFTQRELREALHWSDHALRRHLARLIELEYVVAYRTGQGNQRAYQLLYDGPPNDNRASLLGLADVNQLRKRPPR